VDQNPRDTGVDATSGSAMLSRVKTWS